MIVATAPSIFSVDFSLSALILPAGSVRMKMSTDITAFVLVFPPLDEEDKYCILPYFWVPEETLELRVRRDHVPYDVWERQGKLMTTEGNVDPLV